MKLSVIDTKTSSSVFSDDFDFFSDTCDISKIEDQLRNMWRTMCVYRDEHAEEDHMLNIMTSIDSESATAIALALNISEFAKSMTIFANAYLPKPEGFEVVRKIFKDGCFCWPTVDEQYLTSGEMTPYVSKNNYIYSFSFYDSTNWKHYRMSTIANACRFVPYDVADISQICKAIRQCPKGHRPMVWINPIILEKFIDAKKSTITMENLQTYMSSFIIAMALEDDHPIENCMATQLWDACRAFIEDENPEDLVEMYNIAEDLISSRY